MPGSENPFETSEMKKNIAKVGIFGGKLCQCVPRHPLRLGWVSETLPENETSSLTVPTPDFVPSCSQPKSPTVNFMILYHFYGSKECLCKIFQFFIHGKDFIFALKV